jgi:hypothetical protein
MEALFTMGGGRRLPRYRHRMKNMFAFAFAFGAVWTTGIFVFWCDVTDSWKYVSHRFSALFRVVQSSPQPAPAPRRDALGSLHRVSSPQGLPEISTPLPRTPI